MDTSGVSYWQEQKMGPKTGAGKEGVGAWEAGETLPMVAR